jgi:ribonuclease P protein component
VFPEVLEGRAQSLWALTSELSYEASISAIEDPPETAARVPVPQFNEKRPRHPAQSPPRGPQAPDACLIASACMAAQSPERLCFGRKMHIKQGRDFARVRRDGRRLACGVLLANWQSLPTGAPARLGVVVGGRLGNAVVRSRIRRLLREAFRLHQHDLAQPVDLVLVARASIVGKPLAAVEKDFLAAMRRAGLTKAAA